MLGGSQSEVPVSTVDDGSVRVCKNQRTHVRSVSRCRYRAKDEERITGQPDYCTKSNHNTTTNVSGKR